MRTCYGKQKIFTLDYLRLTEDYLSLLNNFGGGVLWKFRNPVASNVTM